MFIETAVRYGKLNFYAENGKPEKREQFLKQVGVEIDSNFSKKIGKDQAKEVSKGEAVGL